MYLQEIYQSSNKEMFAISLSSCSRYNANFKLDQSQCSLFMTVRHIFEISEDDPVNSIYLPGTITFSHFAVKK